MEDVRQKSLTLHHLLRVWLIPRSRSGLWQGRRHLLAWVYHSRQMLPESTQAFKHSRQMLQLCCRMISTVPWALETRPIRLLRHPIPQDHLRLRLVLTRVLARRKITSLQRIQNLVNLQYSVLLQMRQTTTPTWDLDRLHPYLGLPRMGRRVKDLDSPLHFSGLVLRQHLRVFLRRRPWGLVSEPPAVL